MTMMMRSAVRLACLFVAVVADVGACPDFTWGALCQYQSCGCDGKDSAVCPGGTVGDLPCCEYCPAEGWNCKCGDGCEGTDNCCMYCPSRYLRVGEKMKPFFIMQKPGSIFATSRKATSQQGAAALCGRGAELLYINSAYAEAELEVYINENLNIHGSEHFYLDGFTESAIDLASWRDWEKVTRERSNYCLMLSNSFPGTDNTKSWEVRTRSCSRGQGFKALCKRTEDYYGVYYRSLQIHRPSQKYGAYYTGEVACADDRDPYIAIHSKEDGDKLFNEIERIGLERDDFYIRGYSNKDGIIEASDIIQAPVKRSDNKGTNCVMFRSQRANGTRRKWELYATTCTRRLATISVCYEFFWELY